MSFRELVDQILEARFPTSKGGGPAREEDPTLDDVIDMMDKASHSHPSHNGGSRSTCTTCGEAWEEFVRGLKHDKKTDLITRLKKDQRAVDIAHSVDQDIEDFFVR